MDMAYMDVKPAQPNGHTVVLLHGKNFCAATWEGTIKVLTDAGYRVIAPDQIGFCKSTKPAHYQYSFEQLAANTHALLASLGIDRAIIMGHSMGGMLATRYALTYPADTEQLVRSIRWGWKTAAPRACRSTGVDQLYQTALKTTADSIRDYERTIYYAGTWKPEYDPWVQMQAGMYRGAGRRIVAWNSALTSDMIYTQPVVHELERLTMPVLLMIGDKDTTGQNQCRAAGSAPPWAIFPRWRRRQRRALPHAQAGGVSRPRPFTADPGPGGVSQGAAGRVD